MSHKIELKLRDVFDLFTELFYMDCNQIKISQNIGRSMSNSDKFYNIIDIINL